ncbi:MAG: rhodanese-like domain-containing protein, partial [Pseudomonadota bacterium]
MFEPIEADVLRDWLFDDAELALIDVREAGQSVLGHILFSAPAPYSRFEIELPRLVPNPRVRLVLGDEGDGMAGQAAAAAADLGYTRVFCLAGGVDAWRAAGHTLYSGVNVPSKAFGELVEQAEDTPRMTASDVASLASSSADCVVVDGRPLDEFSRMNIPGARCCPNGELALRIGTLAPDPATTIVVNCAGRTRSIIGAQTLLDLGVPNPVFALENGTQGWVLAGMELERGANGELPDADIDLEAARGRAEAMADRFGVKSLSSDAATEICSDEGITVFFLDVRTEQERSLDSAERRSTFERLNVAHAPGGQLVQATDQWIGVRRARLIVLDDEAVRAPVTAAWLRRLGHIADTLYGGIDALGEIERTTRVSGPVLPAISPVAPAQLNASLSDSQHNVLDLRPSQDYREGHVPGALWTIRPRPPALDTNVPVTLVADDPEVAGLVALDLQRRGVEEITLLEGGISGWIAAGYSREVTPDLPGDPERIDFLSFTHGRHHGNLEASRQYLAWELALVD